jgi:hypothetical protein
MERIERSTSPLPRECSATELHGRRICDLDRLAAAQGAAVLCPCGRTRRRGPLPSARRASKHCPGDFPAGTGKLPSLPDRPRHHRIAGEPLSAAVPVGAGEGNRTLVVSLEGFCSTIELHPRRRNRRQPAPMPRELSEAVQFCSGHGPLDPPGLICQGITGGLAVARRSPMPRRNWWRGKDSNLRRHGRQIYSLLPLTAREPLRTKPGILAKKARSVKRFQGHACCMALKEGAKLRPVHVAD